MRLVASLVGGVPVWPVRVRVQGADVLMSNTAADLEVYSRKLDKLERALEAADGRTMLPADPGAYSGISRRGRSASDAQKMERALILYFETEYVRKQVNGLKRRIQIEQREAEQNATATVDVDGLQNGDYIRFEKHGRSLGNWAQVVRVNAKTITCLAAPGMDQPKIAKDRIRETRKAGS